MKQYNTIKNPLTIIAIFAGITEISGTVVLPLIEKENQDVYMWFLMVFPAILVIIFFTTLNWNYKVLYAPSDFKDDKNFLSILERSSPLERVQNLTDEINLFSDNENTIINNANIVEESGILINDFNIYSKEDYEKDSNVLRDINRKRMKNLKNIEEISFKQIEKQYSTNIARDLKFSTKNKSFYLDGVIENEISFICFEFIYLPSKNIFNISKFENLTAKYNSLFEYFNEINDKKLSLKFICATYLETLEAKTFIEQRFRLFKFDYEVLVFDIDNLNNI